MHILSRVSYVPKTSREQRTMTVVQWEKTQTYEGEKEGKKRKMDAQSDPTVA